MDEIINLELRMEALALAYIKYEGGPTTIKAANKILERFEEIREENRKLRARVEELRRERQALAAAASSASAAPATLFNAFRDSTWNSYN